MASFAAYHSGWQTNFHETIQFEPEPHRKIRARFHIFDRLRVYSTEGNLDLIGFTFTPWQGNLDWIGFAFIPWQGNLDWIGFALLHGMETLI